MQFLSVFGLATTCQIILDFKQGRACKLALLSILRLDNCELFFLFITISSYTKNIFHEICSPSLAKLEPE